MSAYRRTALGWVLVLAGLLAIGAPIGAQAMGLGEARVDSYLNQPLDIRIRLLDASDVDLDSLTVGPASPADYGRLGVSSNALALDLDFEIDRSSSPSVIRITSSRAVSDPIVQLLVDARWSSGRMLREYTLFLDPPTLDVAPPAAPAPVRAEQETRAPVQRPTRSAAGSSPTSVPSESAPSESTSSPAARAVRTRDGGQRTVRAGDTLWSIASANLPASDISMSQMMVAIVELNPQAFRNGNVHQMLRDSQLELPSAEQARGIDSARAAATVQAQNRAFNQRLTGDVPVVSDAARGGEPESPSSPDPEPANDSSAADPREPEPEARLELVPSSEDSTGSGLDDEGAEADRLRQQLARTEEELFTARLEAEDFRSRLTDLEALVEDNPTGAGIADAELAGLERTLRAARMAAAEDADPELRDEVTAQLDDYLARFESAADATGDGTAPGTESTAMETDAESVSPETEDPGREESGSEEPVVTQVGSNNDRWWSSPLVLPLAGLVVLLILLGAVGFALQRRRREAAAETPIVGGGTTGPSSRREPEMASSRGGRDDDPIERARGEVADSPSDLGAHLALLHALASEEDTERFSGALEDMFEHVETGTEPAWREALELAGRVVPGHVLVKGSADWMSSSEDERRPPLDELDEESEVGDLMSRLESESDEETDDSDWIGAESKTPAKPAGESLPTLHDDETDPLVLGGQQDDEASVRSETESDELASPRKEDEGNEDEAFSTEWLAEDDGVSVNVDEDDDAGRAAGNAGGAASESSTEGGDEADDEATDRLLMDWTESADEGESASAATDEGEAGGDIFAPSDDDVDVKLDLARAYLSWNSTDSAKTLLEEIVREGNDEQKEQAQKLLDDL